MKRQLALFALSILILVSLACSQSVPVLPFLAPTATPTATPIPLPPTVIETVPPVGSELPLQSPLTVYFSEKMERASVESALTADFSGGFLFSWLDDATLMLTPKAALPSDGKVTLTLAASAKAANGLALLEPIALSYQTAGALRVAQVLPAPLAADVSPDSVVVVTFNQPVVPLGADAASLPAGVTLEPTAAGSGEWLNTSTYVFRAEPALSGGVDYVAKVNPQLVSTSGTTLDPNSANMTWGFRTSLPRIDKITPAAGVDLALDPEIQITFNQPMERASIEGSFAFSGPQGKVDGKMTWNEKASVLTYKPAARLERDTVYELTIGGQSRALGGALLGNDFSADYRTVQKFGMWYTSFNSGEPRPRDLGVAITFTAPLAEYEFDELEKLVAISPAPPYFNFYREGRTVNVYGGFKPGAIYNVTFPASLKDQWGQELGRDYVFSFREPDAQPALQLGFYLPVLFARPENPALFVQAVNVNRIQISRAVFPLDEFFRFRNNYDYRQGYIPANVESWNESTNLVVNQNDPLEVRFTRKSSLPTGLYHVDVSSDEVKNTFNTAHPLLVSNINVTLKASATSALVWAVDLRTQTPVSNVPLTVYDQDGVLITTGVTDEYGLWQGDVPYSAEYNHTPTTVVLAQPGDEFFGMAMTDWNQGISPWDFDLRADTSGPRPEVYLYSDRPVYRPGDTVHYRGVLRNQYNGRYTEPALNAIPLEIHDPNGKIADANPQVSEYGTFNGDFTLPANAIPGGYSLNVTSASGIIYSGNLYFQVADYRKPEINLSVELGPDPAISGQLLTGKIRAEYFFGGPVTDLPFQWRLYSRRDFFSIPEYRTGIYRMDWLSTGPSGFPYKSGAGRTDANGNFNLRLEDVTVSDTTQLTLEITASESGGFPVSARATQTMHPADFYAGIRPQAWFSQAGTEMVFNLLTVDLAQNPVAKTLKADFQKVRWERTQLQYGYDFKPVYTPLENKSVTTGADGKGLVAFTPKDPGTYVLDVTGGQAHTQILLWVGGAENAVWPALPYQQVKLTPNKDNYKAGDQAEIFIPNDFNTPTLALITVERGTLLGSQVVNIPAGGYKFSLPLTDEHAPNAFVSATLLGAENDFRQGYVNLPVEPTAFVLNVALKATPEKAKPGDTLTLDLHVTDAKGQPVQGEFSLAVVDLAALALADPNSADIVPAYYNLQPLGVRTGLTAAVYSKRYYNPAGGIGGGGGDEVLTIREKFPDTAYWKADIITDALGNAQITLKLPDNLTTWQVDTRGLTKDTKVGQARVQVKTSKDLLIRPSTPRFLVVGDHATLAANVNNTTSQLLEATVSLQANGLSLDDPATAEQKVQIPANGRIRVVWSGRVQDGEAVDAIFSVKSAPSAGSGQEFQDAARPTDGPIPVVRYVAPQTFSTAGILSDVATRQEILALPKTFQPQGGSLQLELSPSLAAAILSELKARELPEKYWSNEQIVSDFLPNLATYQALKTAGITDAGLALATSLNKDSIHLLLANQGSSGGWSWAVDSLKTDPYLTAYILFALGQVPADFNIDATDSMKRAREYLLTVQPMNNDVNPDDRGMFNRWVFIAYIMQTTGGSVDVGIFDNLYFNREKLEPWAKALLAQSLAAFSPTDERIRELVSALETSALRTATGVYWESQADNWQDPNSPLFTTAMIVYSLAQRDPANPLLAEAVRYLSSQRGATRWGADYERAWIILALNRYMQATGELQGNFSFSAALNGAPLAEGQAAGPENMTSVTATAPLTQLNLAGANTLSISRQAGAGKLYYRAALSVDRPVETAPALNQGLAVSRKYLACEAKTCDPVTSYQLKPDASGRIKVQLTVTLPNDSYYLMVEDYIPAGADILDTALKTSQQGEQSLSVDVDPTNPFNDGWGWWYFNRPQIYKDHILWSADYLPAGTYVLTYTIIPSLAGEYRVLPAHAWQAFFPEVQGTTAGEVFSIKP